MNSSYPITLLIIQQEGLRLFVVEDEIDNTAILRAK